MQMDWRPIVTYFVWLIGLPVLLLIVFRIGIAFGYAFLGGHSLAEGFSTSAWKHVVDLIFK